jgi:hypothetical protein
LAKKISKLIGAKRAVGLIFCEDENDAVALSHISHAVRGDLPRLQYCRKPLILMRDQKQAEARKKNAADVAAVVRAWQQAATVKLIIAHQDCDEVEPAHEVLSERVKTELEGQGLTNVLAVAPAWETEAWWFLWPDAVAAVNSKWRRLSRTGNHGKIKDAKETLRRDLRSPKTRDYEESDSRRISENVKTLSLIGVKTGTSNSFELFSADLIALEI